jgi:zinc transporter ZupT
MKMKILILCFILFAIVLSHGNHGKKKTEKTTKTEKGSEHDHNQAHSKDRGHTHDHAHDHSHDHEHGKDHHHHHGHGEASLFAEYNKKASIFLYEKLSPLSAKLQAYSGALIISSAPMPIFILMMIFNKTNLKILDIFSAFASGALLGDVLLHNLPELMENNEPVDTACVFCNFLSRKETLIILGILFLFFIEKLLGLFGSHDHKEGEHGHSHANLTVTFIGDFLHNLTDGLAIGASFAKGKC